MPIRNDSILRELEMNTISHIFSKYTYSNKKTQQVDNLRIGGNVSPINRRGKGENVHDNISVNIYLA